MAKERRGGKYVRKDGTVSEGVDRRFEKQYGDSRLWEGTGDKQYIFKMPNGEYRYIRADNSDSAKQLAGKGAKQISSNKRKKLF